jgi:hypothetical protein
MSQANPMRPAEFMTRPEREFGKPVCRLGLASHGRTGLSSEDVLHAVSRGVNFLNWSGFAEGAPDDEAFPAAVASLGRERDRVTLCVQFAARTDSEAAAELRSVLAVSGLLDCVMVRRSTRPSRRTASGCGPTPGDSREIEALTSSCRAVPISAG